VRNLLWNVERGENLLFNVSVITLDDAVFLARWQSCVVGGSRAWHTLPRSYYVGSSGALSGCQVVSLSACQLVSARRLPCQRVYHRIVQIGGGLYCVQWQAVRALLYCIGSLDARIFAMFQFIFALVCVGKC